MTVEEQTLVRAIDVGRRYGEAVAVDGVRLDIAAGELVGLLGPNGAGKTTLLNLMIGLRRASTGRVELFGRDPHEPAARASIGVTPQETGLPATLRVTECLGYVAAHYRDPVAAGELLERFGLIGLERRQIGGLSGGQQRRLAVALAFVGRPRLVFLDEPTTGLDVEARHALWGAIREFHAEGGTVVLTSHYLEEVEALAERVVVLSDGRVVVDGGMEEVRAMGHVRRISVTADRLPTLSGVLDSVWEGRRARLTVTDADVVVRELVGSGVDFTDLEIQSTSLEDAFLALTGPDRPTELTRSA